MCQSYIDWLPLTCPPACNPGMCPDWESNWWPFSSHTAWCSAHWATPARAPLVFLNSTEIYYFKLARSPKVGQFWSLLIQWLNVVKDTDSFHLSPGYPNWIGFCPLACPFMVSLATSLLADFSWILSPVLPEGVSPQEIWGVGLTPLAWLPSCLSRRLSDLTPAVIAPGPWALLLAPSWELICTCS